MARVNPAAITTAPSQAPFTLRPLIRDMIKTRRCIPGSIFIVEGIDVMPMPAATPEEDDDAHAVRLLLGDGELCIQALLHPDMFYQVEKRDVFVGCYVRVGNFMMRLEEPEGNAVGGNILEHRDEEKGEDKEAGEKENGKAMAYLIVNELETAGWNETYMAMWRRHEKGKEVEKVAEDADAQTELSRQDQETVSNEAQTTPKAAKQRKTVVRFADPPVSPTAQTPTEVKGHDKGKAKVTFEMPGVVDHDLGNDINDNDDDGDDDDDDLEDAFEAFEARTFPLRTAAPRKPAASNAGNAAAAAAVGDDDDDDDDKSQQQPVALPRDWHNHQVPLKLTTLRLIPHLPYAQNWSVNVLAIVASLSPVEPSHLPPGKQRTARIADPSTAKQVHLTVFLDPDEFTPKVGSAVLLVGVKNHRFDGGSLKKYASDGKRDIGNKWWFEDPWELEWLDVAGIKSWWKGMEEYYSQSGSARNAE